MVRQRWQVFRGFHGQGDHFQGTQVQEKDCKRGRNIIALKKTK